MLTNEVFDMAASLDLIFNADAPDRQDWLERITPAEMEWYYANGYIH